MDLIISLIFTKSFIEFFLIFSSFLSSFLFQFELPFIFQSFFVPFIYNFLFPFSFCLFYHLLITLFFMFFPDIYPIIIIFSLNYFQMATQKLNIWYQLSYIFHLFSLDSQLSLFLINLKSSNNILIFFISSVRHTKLYEYYIVKGKEYLWK